MEKTRRRKKIQLAVVLLLIFAATVQSVPVDRLAWLGPLVMGGLLVPSSISGFSPLLDAGTQSDSVFSLLAFLSIVAIFCLSFRWLFAGMAANGGARRQQPFHLSMIEWTK